MLALLLSGVAVAVSVIALVVSTSHYKPSRRHSLIARGAALGVAVGRSMAGAGITGQDRRNEALRLARDFCRDHRVRVDDSTLARMIEAHLHLGRP